MYEYICAHKLLVVTYKCAFLMLMHFTKLHTRISFWKKKTIYVWKFPPGYSSGQAQPDQFFPHLEMPATVQFISVIWKKKKKISSSIFIINNIYFAKIVRLFFVVVAFFKDIISMILSNIDILFVIK